MKQNNFLSNGEYSTLGKKKIKNYNKFISKNKNTKIENIIKINSTNELKKGDLYYKGLFGGYFGVKISEKERKFKTTMYKISIIDKKITKHYLLWYLKQKPIQDYLSLFIKGSVIPFLPRKDFYQLKIQFPTKNLKISSKIKETKIKFNSPYRDVLEILYKEYETNEKSQNMLSCAVLAGAISESILLGYLKDNDLKDKHLERKTLGNLIEIAEIKKFEDGFPYEAFIKIQKLRNNVHPEKLMKSLNKKPQRKIWNDLKYLNKIIGYFGI